MAYLKIKNRAISALAADITDIATSLTVTAGEGAKFPSAGDFNITIEDEILKCTARSTDTLTVTRAQEGTTAAAHVAGKAVELRITAGVLDSRTTWTADKLLKGAGAGVDPTEIDVPSAGATLTVAETEVFNGTSPTAWTDINLSATIGANSALVLLKIANAVSERSYAVRKNGDIDEFYSLCTVYGKGVALSDIPTAHHVALLVAADAAGIIEWKCEVAQTTTVDIIAYIK